MKQVILFLLVLILALAPVNAAKDAYAAGGGSLTVSLLKYEPVPAYAGDSMDVWVKLDNTGGDIEKNLQLEFLDNYPFKLESDSRKVHDIGALAGSYDYVAKFNVRVDPASPVGQAFIKVRYIYKSTGRSTEFLLPIDIESRITTLAVESIETSPENLQPGEKGTIIVRVKNIATSMIRDVTANLDLQDSDAPIAPLNSVTELKLDSLAPGESHEFLYTVIAQFNAEANAYEIPLGLTYKDDSGEVNEYDQTIGVIVSAEPDLVLTVDSSDIYSDEPSGTVTLKFVNKGVDEIKFVYIELLPSDDYDLLSPTDKYYVGNIDTDDYEVEEITLRATNLETLEIPMKVEYRDASNKLYTVNEKVILNLVEKSEVEGSDGNNTTTIIIVIVVLVAGVYFWRKRKKKHKHK